MDEPSFPQWSELLYDVKLKIIPMMNYKTRRHLRNCSRADKQLVDMFPYREEMKISSRLCSSTGKWCCRYESGKKRTDYNKNPAFEMFFDTCDEAYDYMKRVIRTAEKVTLLQISSELNSKIVLRDGRNLINVEKLYWYFIGGETNGETMACYNFLFSQINLQCLKKVYINMEELQNINPEINDDFFEIEKSAMSLESFSMDGLINNEQLLSLRTNQIELFNSGSITSSAFVRLIQEKIRRPPPKFSFKIYQISAELQFYLFGELYEERGNINEFLFNLPGSDLKLNIEFTLQDETESYDDEPLFSTYIEMRFCRVEIFLLPRPYDVNTESLDAYPSLHNFISAISRVIPIGFPLMQDLRNR